LRILNTKDPNISIALLPWFVPNDQSRLEIGWELHERLKDRPDDTLCLIGIENNNWQIMCIAYTDDDCVWVWQVRALPGFKYQRIFEDALATWAGVKGKRTLKMKCLKRLRKFFTRRYGYRPCGSYMERKL
jgi:hypothetical protein